MNFLKRFWARLVNWPSDPPFRSNAELTDEEVAKLKADFSEAVKKRAPEVIPAFTPRHVYGGKGTIHKTSTVDVVLDDKGEVCQVWFRCLELPFTVDRRDHSPGYYNPGDSGYDRRIAIEEITYALLPDEGEE